MPQAGFVSIRDAIFAVGPIFTRITGRAKGESSIKISQDEPDSGIIEGALGDATFWQGVSYVRTWELLLLPTAADVTLLQQLKATGVPFDFKYEFGETKLTGFAIMSKDVDIVVGSPPPPITAVGMLWAGNKVMGRQGITLG